MMARHAVPIFHPGHSLFFQKGEAARYRIPNRSIVDWCWIIGPDRSADGTEAKQGRKDHAGHRRPHSFDGGALKSKNRRRGRQAASVGDQEVPASVYRHSTGVARRLLSCEILADGSTFVRWREARQSRSAKQAHRDKEILAISCRPQFL